MPRDLPLSNGRLLVAFDASYALRELTYPHVGQENHTMGRQSRVFLRLGSVGTWVGGDGWVNDLRYEDRSMVTAVRTTHAGLGLRVSAQDAVDPDAPVLARRLTVFNDGPDTRSGTLWFHHDFDPLECDAFVGVGFDPTGRYVFHHRRRCWILVATDDRVVTWTCDARTVHGGRGVAGKIEDGDAFDSNPVSIGAVDAALGIPITLPPGGSFTVPGFLVLGTTEEQAHRHLQAARALGVEGIFARSREHTEEVVRDLPETPSLPEPVRLALPRHLLILETQLDHGGSISAANDSETLFPGRESYAYCWPRDGALVAHALDRAGRSREAARFFRYAATLMRPDGWLPHRAWADGSEGSSWMPRIRGGQAVLPLQEDETALVIWALGQHVRRTQDLSLAQELFSSLVSPGSRFLAAYRDPSTGLPEPSFDLWEERWGVHTFTAMTVVVALREAAHLCDLVGGNEAASWRDAADEVDRGVERYLFHDDLGRYVRTGHRDEGGGYWLDPVADASLFFLPLISARSVATPRMAATIRTVRQALSVPGPLQGIARYEGDPFLRPPGIPDHVPGNPWVLCELALAGCELLSAAKKDRDVGHARLVRSLARSRPSGVLPEQVHPETGHPIGTAPLTWSHAMALWIGLLAAERDAQQK